MEDLQKWIKSYPDFPSKGILFRDISPLLAEPSALSLLKEKFVAFWYTNFRPTEKNSH